jgi:hypothetical protein
MKESPALIERVRQINAQFQQIDLTIDARLTGLKAGQALLARPDTPGLMPYLRALWFPVNLEKGTLTVERPLDERYEPGQVLHLTGLIGKPFRFRRTLRSVLLIALDTPPVALLMPIVPLISSKVSVTLLLLGSAVDYDTGHLPAELEIIHGDGELNWPNRVTTIGWADQVFVTVPEGSEQAALARVWRMFSELRADLPVGYLYGVFRPPMPCGMGACDACYVKTRNGDLAACLEGPAFDLTTVKLGERS